MREAMKRRAISKAKAKGGVSKLSEFERQLTADPSDVSSWGGETKSVSTQSSLAGVFVKGPAPYMSPAVKRHSRLVE